MTRLNVTTNALYHTANDETVTLRELIDVCSTSAEVIFHSFRKSVPTLELDDLSQEVVYRALNGIAGFDTRKASLKTWVSCIARNYVLDFSARERRRPYVVTDLVLTNRDGEEFLLPGIDEYRCDAFEADYDLLNAEALDEIEEAIGGLSEDRRRAVELTREGNKPREIAKITGWPSDKVYRLLSRGRHDLAERLDSETLQKYGIAA